MAKITVNMFANVGNAYAGRSQVYAVNYPQLQAGTNGSPKETNVTNGFTIQPAVSLARQTAGMVPWNGDAETLERIACDPEFGILESP